MENTIKFWGSLDVASRAMEDIPEGFEALYAGCQYRMRPEDIKRMKKYLSRLSVAQSKIKLTLKKFEVINK